MLDRTSLRSSLLEALGAQTDPVMPMPAEYWRRQLMAALGKVSLAETLETLEALEESGLIASAADPLGIRRYSITPAGRAALS